MIVIIPTSCVRQNEVGAFIAGGVERRLLV